MAHATGILRRLQQILMRCVFIVVAAPIRVMHRAAMRLDDWLFPQLRSIDVINPVFIVGPPRSGTTAVHRCLARDPRFTTMPLWELLLAPALCQKYTLRWFYRWDQHLGGLLTWLVQSVFGRLMVDARVHQTSLQLPEEDHLGLFPFGGSFLEIITAPNNRRLWNVGYFSGQLTLPQKQKLLNAYRMVIVRHLHFRGRHLQYLSKSPCFSAWLHELKREFPTARFVGTWRPPTDVVASQLSSISPGLRLFGYGPGQPFIVGSFLQLLLMYYEQLKSFGEQNPDRFRQVVLDEFKEDCERVVVQAYRDLRLPMSASFRRQLATEIARVRGYQSHHEYRLSDFGLTEEGIESMFREHLEPRRRGDATAVSTRTQVNECHA